MPTIDRVAAAVQRYFTGERQETLAILAYAIVLVVSAALLARTRDRFAVALAIGLAASALVAGGTAIPLLRRDGPHRDRLLAALTTPAAAEAVAAEAQRLDRVIANYVVYRIGFAIAAVIAVGLLLATHGATSRGVTVALLLFGATGVVIDHYSEARARRYRAELGASP